MHGRLKIKTSAEQEAEKKKERAIKQKKYLAGIDLVFSKRKKGIHDQEALAVTAQLLVANPDALTLWNCRREVLLGFKSNIIEEEWQKLLEEELKTTEYCLIKNPKSYGAWHHRDWVFKFIPIPPYKEELELCDRYVQLDERNFHCWDHRRLIVSRSERQLSDELALTGQLIDKNFSNFSAWHYRAKLLPRVHPPAQEESLPVPEEIFLQELKKVVAAIFTDPSDQSPWFFLRWLLGQKEEEQRFLQIGLLPSDREEFLFVLVFNREVLSNEGISISVNDEKISTERLQPHNNRCVWLLPLHLDGNKCKIGITHAKWKSEISLAADLKALPYFKWISDATFGETNLSEKSKSALMEIMENCVTLDQLDPGNKWVLLTLVNIMSILHSSSHQNKVLGYLSQLESSDPLRLNYYKDLRSKIIFENLLTSLPKNSETFDAAHLGLTRLVFPQYLCSSSYIDLRGNCFRSLKSATCFLSCVKLILDETPIRDLSPLGHLSLLKQLSLKSCGISSLKVLEDLWKNKSLVRLCVENNDVIEEENFEIKVKTLIPSLTELLF